MQINVLLSSNEDNENRKRPEAVSIMAMLFASWG